MSAIPNVSTCNIKTRNTYQSNHYNETEHWDFSKHCLWLPRGTDERVGKGKNLSTL
jgi:hypothetical protein